jgi:hypothetical protein
LRFTQFCGIVRPLPKYLRYVSAVDPSVVWLYSDGSVLFIFGKPTFKYVSSQGGGAFAPSTGYQADEAGAISNPSSGASTVKCTGRETPRWRLHLSVLGHTQRQSRIK